MEPPVSAVLGSDCPNELWKSWSGAPFTATSQRPHLKVRAAQTALSILLGTAVGESRPCHTEIPTMAKKKRGVTWGKNAATCHVRSFKYMMYRHVWSCSYHFDFILNPCWYILYLYKSIRQPKQGICWSASSLNAAAGLSSVGLKGAK